MIKSLQTMLLLTILVALLVAVAGLTTPALAYGMSVLPGKQTLSSSSPVAYWYFSVADRSGCPENNIKFKVTFGDGGVLTAAISRPVIHTIHLTAFLQC